MVGIMRRLLTAKLVLHLVDARDLARRQDALQARHVLAQKRDAVGPQSHEFASSCVAVASVIEP
jgi:hypothetical protein